MGEGGDRAQIAPNSSLVINCMLKLQLIFQNYDFYPVHALCINLISLIMIQIIIMFKLIFLLLENDIL